MRNNENNKDNIDIINYHYLKELENNSNIFNQKIKNLNDSILNSEKKNISYITKSNKNHKKIRLNKSQIMNENNKYKNILSQRDLNLININDTNNYTFKVKQKEKEKKIREDNFIEINKELKKRMKEIENENDNKDYLINDLKNQIQQMNEKYKKYDDINCFDYNQLMIDNDDKKNTIQKLENIIKNLNSTIEDLNFENKNIKEENLKLKNKIDNILSKDDINKINCLDIINEINKLKLDNKILNIEYQNLTEKYELIKQEKEKQNSLIEELNIIIYNYQKQLNPNINTNISLNGSNVNIEPKNENKLTSKYEYKKYDYNNEEYTSQKITNNEINYLENYLSSLLREKCKLENELIEIVNYPKTLSDIKLKTNINDKIILNEKEIKKIRYRLKLLRGY